MRPKVTWTLRVEQKGKLLIRREISYRWGQSRRSKWDGLLDVPTLG